MSADNPVFALAMRWLTPLGALFAFTLLANWPAGSGVGVVAGLLLALTIVLNALVFGVRSVLAAAPGAAWRLLLAIGLITVLPGAGFPNFGWSAQVIEGGAFATTVSAVSLATLALMGRAGALRDAAW